MNEGSFEILEQCLEATESGADIETCLSPFPEMANELRPLLEAAQIARSMRDDYVPNAALQRSRSRLLLRAASLRKQDRSKPGFGRLPRIAFAALALALLVFLTWQGLVVAAAKALPGDALYPYKLTAEDLSLKIAQDADARQLRALEAILSSAICGSPRETGTSKLDCRWGPRIFDLPNPNQRGFRKWHGGQSQRLQPG